jgi:hypothetical protein
LGKEINNTSLRQFRNKRNQILIILLSVFLLAIVLLIVTFVLKFDSTLITTIMLPVVLGYLVLLLSLKGKLDYSVMNIKYHLMLEDENGTYKLSRKIFTEKWLEYLVNDSFTLFYDENNFSCYYKLNQKLENVILSGTALVIIIIAKDSKFDFYSPIIDKVVDHIYDSLDVKKRKIKKQIVLQYKKYEEPSKDTKKEIDRIICFRSKENYLINITIGYFPKYDQIYFLCPKTKYPNVFYHYGCNLIKNLSFVKEENKND